MKKEPPDGGSFLHMMGNRRCVGAGFYPARDVCFVLPTTGYFPFLDKRGKFRYLSPTGYFCQ